MLRLCTAANLPEAHLLLHRLMHAGIEARVLNEHAQGGLGDIPFTHAYPEIWIMEAADAPRAREIVREFERAPLSPDTAQCQACGEFNPQGFEICWSCGKPLSREP
ncbi:MAG: DUF2007 domain-containing protein [Sulfuricaulis sp.]|nr:DUF2007 domain-containing protein [Sulfuricaulis sp.]